MSFLSIKVDPQTGYEYVDIRPAVCVLAYDPQTYEVVLVSVKRPNKPASIELPAGYVEPNETPASAAVRELQEETGIVVNKEELIHCFDYAPAPGYSNQIMSLFFTAVPRLRLAVDKTNVDKEVNNIIILPLKIVYDKYLYKQMNDGKDLLLFNILYRQLGGRINVTTR